MQSDRSARSDIRAFDAVRALAFIGDLSMGQPTDHSPRTAWLALQLAQADGMDATGCDTVREASLLRWSGCTANASGFADALGDDIAGREAMLAMRPDWDEPMRQTQGGTGAAIQPLAQIHCEVSGEVARMLGLGHETETTLRHIFETWDGNGLPARIAGLKVPAAVFIVVLAGDIEILSRVYGIERAFELIGQRADSRYPARLVALLSERAQAWLTALDALQPREIDDALLTAQMQQVTSLELIADVIDLKLPWMTGFSREVAAIAAACCERLSLDRATQERVYRAGLIHGIGRAAVPNALWNMPGRLPASAWEKVRLVPYWTARAGKQTGTLEQAAELASFAYERLDGTGYFRSAGNAALPVEARVLAASAAWVAMRSPRPWREAMSRSAAAELMRAETAQGRFDTAVTDALLASGTAQAPSERYGTRPQAVRLSAREIDVLRSISRGASNKEAARELELSPSTVRTHVESVFRKLECSTRAAATLKASGMGFL